MITYLFASSSATSTPDLCLKALGPKPTPAGSRSKTLRRRINYGPKIHNIWWNLRKNRMSLFRLVSQIRGSFLEKSTHSVKFQKFGLILTRGTQKIDVFGLEARRRGVLSPRVRQRPKRPLYDLYKGIPRAIDVFTRARTRPLHDCPKVISRFLA